MINKLIDIRKEFIDSVSPKSDSLTPTQTYFSSNTVACISMAIDYLMAYEKSTTESKQDSEKVS